MKRVFKWQNTLCLIAGVIAASCAIDHRIEIPLPPDVGSTPGASAYDLWLVELSEGRVADACDGTPWDADKNTMADFFEFLRGCDGADGDIPTIGPNGNWFIGGEDTGIAARGDDGKTPEIGSNGNWWIDGGDTGVPARGMTGDDGAPGKDGKSAYELWLDDLEAGRIVNHCDGTAWDPDNNTMAYFWEYLFGCKGDEGAPSNSIVNPGLPGGDMEIVQGKPNVIAQYTDQPHSEYVDSKDGSVTYQVYGTNQLPVGSGVVVTGMPGMPGETFTTDGNGKFKVAKGQLPTSGTTADRFGTAKVGVVTSAANTYVPQKIEVRLMIGRNNLSSPELVPTLSGDSGDELNGGAYVDVPFRAQRRVTADGEWVDIPSWIADTKRQVRAVAVDPATAAPNRSVELIRRLDVTRELKGDKIGVRRPTIRATWIPLDEQEDNYYMYESGVTPETFTVVVDDDPVDNMLYGEYPHARAVIRTAPVNFHPLPTKLEMHTFTPDAGDDGSLLWTSALFGVSEIDTRYLFAGTYTASQQTPVGVDPFTVYAPVANTTNSKCIAVAFGLNASQAGDPNMCAINDPSYTVNNIPVLVGSYVYLRTSTRLVVGPGALKPVGQLVKTSDAPAFAIRAVPPFNFYEIPITYTP